MDIGFLSKQVFRHPAETLVTYVVDPDLVCLMLVGKEWDKHYKDTIPFRKSVIEETRVDSEYGKYKTRRRI